MRGVIKRVVWAAVCWASLLGCNAAAVAADVTVAVAANFHSTLQRLLPAFEAATGHHVSLSAGASGALAAQIMHGAPYDVFLSADQARPLALEQRGLVVPGSRFTYAQGVLALWSADPDKVDRAGAALRAPEIRHVAIADPRIAPYGLAAQQVLEHLGMWSDLRREGRLVTGHSIGQTYSQIASGAAPLGFVAWAQVQEAGGSWWLPPQAWYAPINQDAVLLQRAADSLAARVFLHWLQHDAAVRAQIEAAGYRLPLPASGVSDVPQR